GNVAAFGAYMDKTMPFDRWHDGVLDYFMIAEYSDWDTTCQPTTCAAQGKNCGEIPNGCNGRALDCGSCSLPQTCGGGGVPNVCCGSTACQSGQCGTVPPSGFVGEHGCGGCPSDQLCGATALNQCGNGPPASFASFANQVLQQINQRRALGGSCTD